MEWNIENNFSMEWNTEGKFLVWNGYEMEEILQYGIWKNRLPFHSMPCPPPIFQLAGFLLYTTVKCRHCRLQ